MNMLKITTPDSVENGMLAKLNEIAIDITRESGDTLASTGITLSFRVSVTIRCEGDSQFKNASGEDIGKTIVTNPSYTTTVYFGVGTTRLFIPKDELTIFECAGSPTARRLVFSNFKLVSRLQSFISSRLNLGVYNKLEFFDVSKAITFYASGAGIIDWVENGNFSASTVKNVNGLSGTIATLSTWTKAEVLLLQGCTGNIESLASCTRLLQFAVSTPGSSQCVGTVEGLAAGMVANGRTSGSLSLALNTTAVTYNGNPIIYGLRVDFNPSYDGGYQIVVV